MSRSPVLRASPLGPGSVKHGSPAHCSPRTPERQRQRQSPAAGTEEATPPVESTGGLTEGITEGITEGSAPAGSKRSPPSRPPPPRRETERTSPNTPTKRSPPVPRTPRPFKTPDGTPEREHSSETETEHSSDTERGAAKTEAARETFEEATPPKQSEPTDTARDRERERAPLNESDASLRLSAAGDDPPVGIVSPAESPNRSETERGTVREPETPKRKPSRPPPVPDAARQPSGSTTTPSPNPPKIPPKSPDVLKRMRQLSKPDTDSDRPSSPAMSSISEAASDDSRASVGAESEPEPEPEPPVAAVSLASELILAKAKAKAAAEAEAKTSLREFWIPFHEIKFGQPIDSGAFGTVYRGNYLGPVAVKSIRQQEETQGGYSNGSTPRDGGAANAELEDTEAQQLLLSGQTRLVEEIRAQTRFHHQNVVQFLGLASGRPPHCPSALHWLVVTELCDQNLYQVLHNGRELPWHIRFKLGLDIAQGMTYLHEKQVRRPLTHLPLPANLRLTLFAAGGCCSTWPTSTSSRPTCCSRARTQSSPTSAPCAGSVRGLAYRGDDRRQNRPQHYRKLRPGQLLHRLHQQTTALRVHRSKQKKTARRRLDLGFCRLVVWAA